jgi:putative spermidine/putrescine transport system ATP-binding protein
VRARASFRTGSPVVVAVRPEAMMLGEGQSGEFNNLRAVLSDVVYLGSKTQFLLQGGAAGDIIVEMTRAPQGAQAPGTEIAIRWRIDDTMVFPAP